MKNDELIFGPVRQEYTNFAIYELMMVVNVVMNVWNGHANVGFHQGPRRRETAQDPR